MNRVPPFQRALGADINEIVKNLQDALERVLKDLNTADPFGQLYLHENALTTVLAVADTWYPIRYSARLGEVLDMGASTSENTLTIKKPGVYQVAFVVASNVSNANRTLDITIAKNGTHQHQAHTQNFYQNASVQADHSISSFLRCAQGDRLDLRARCVGSTTTMLITDGSFTAHWVGP